jgi:hypothetical protein
LSKSKGRATDTTGLIVLKEYFKLASALFQVMFCCSDVRILPNTLDWSNRSGFSEPFFNPMQVVLNAIHSIMIVYWYLHAPRLTETQVVTLQMLVANSQGHLLVLDVIRKRLIQMNKPKSVSKKTTFSGNVDTRTTSITKSTSSSSSSSSSIDQSSNCTLMISTLVDDSSIEVFKNKRDLDLAEVPLLKNAKLEMLSHLPECIRHAGCDNNVRNTELGELFMKLVRCIWNSTSKRFSSVEYEMLKKYIHLQVLDVIKKGINDRKGVDVFAQKRQSTRKMFVSDTIVAELKELSFAFNCTSKPQALVWVVDKETFETMDGSCLNVHNILLDVS